MTSTMKSNSIRKEFEDVALLRHARSSGSEQARGCELAVLAPVPEGGFAPLYGVAERALGNVVSRFDPWIPYKGKQSLGMVEKEPSQCTDFSVGAVQMAFRQREEFLLQWDRLLDQLVAIEVAVAKSMPEPKEPGMQRQSVTGKAIRDRGPGELLYSKQVSFQVGPTKLGDALGKRLASKKKMQLFLKNWLDKPRHFCYRRMDASRKSSQASPSRVVSWVPRKPPLLRYFRISP